MGGSDLRRSPKLQGGWIALRVYRGIFFLLFFSISGAGEGDRAGYSGGKRKDGLGARCTNCRLSGSFVLALVWLRGEDILWVRNCLYCDQSEY